MTFNSNSNYFDPTLQERIAERLANLFTPVGRIDRVLFSIVKACMEELVVPYYSDVISRHTEQEFHTKLAQGFDLVEDMRLNHERIFNGFMRVCKRLKNRLIFNEGVMVDMIIDIVTSPPYNWFIVADERLKLYDMVSRLKMEIYS